MNVKRVLSFVLAMAMVFSMVPMSVFAEEGEAPVVEEPAAIVEQVEEPAEKPAEEPVEGGDDSEGNQPAAPAEGGDDGEGNEPAAPAEGGEGELTDVPAMLLLRRPGKPGKPDPEPESDPKPEVCGHPLKLGKEYEDPENISCELVLKGNGKEKHYDAVLTGYITVVCEKCGKETDNLEATATVKNNNDKKIKFDIIEENGEKILNNQSDVEGYAKENKLWKLVGDPKCGAEQKQEKPEVTTSNLEDITVNVVGEGGYLIPSLNGNNGEEENKHENEIFIYTDDDNAYYIAKIVIDRKTSYTYEQIEEGGVVGVEFNSKGECVINVKDICENEENGINEIKSITAYVKTKQTKEGFVASFIDALPEGVSFYSAKKELNEYDTGYKAMRHDNKDYTSVNGIEATVIIDNTIKVILGDFYDDTEAKWNDLNKNEQKKYDSFTDYLNKAWAADKENGITVNEDDISEFLNVDAESMEKFGEYDWYVLKLHNDENVWHVDGVVKKKYSVSIERGEGVASGENNLGSYISGKTVEFTVKAKEGYVIDEVTADNAEVTNLGEGKYSVTVGDKDIKITATAAKLYTITASAENGTVNGQYPASVKSGDTFEFTVTPDEGYEVDKVTVTTEKEQGGYGHGHHYPYNPYYGLPNGPKPASKNVVELTADDGIYSFEVTKDAEINATFKLKEYEVTTDVAYGAKIVETIEGTYEHFDKVEFTVELDETYYGLVSVKANEEVLTADENGKYSFTVTDNTEVTVETSEIFYDVTFEGENFTVEGDYTAIKPLYNATFSVKANDGYRLVSVKLGENELTADENGKYTVNMDSDKTVTVETVKTYTVTVIDSKGGKVTYPNGEALPAAVDAGSTLNIKAAPNNHNRLVKVIVNNEEVATNNGFYTISNINNDIMITAEFDFVAKIFVRKDGGKVLEVTSENKKVGYPTNEYTHIGEATISGELFKAVYNYTTLANEDFTEFVAKYPDDIDVKLNENATNKNGYTYYVLKNEADCWHIDAVNNYAVTVDPKSFGTVITVNGEELAGDEKVVVPAGTKVEYAVAPIALEGVQVHEAFVNGTKSNKSGSIEVYSDVAIKGTAKVMVDFFLANDGVIRENVTTKNLSEMVKSVRGDYTRYGCGYIKGDFAKMIINEGYYSMKIEQGKFEDTAINGIFSFDFWSSYGESIYNHEPWFVIKYNSGRWRVEGALNNTVTYIVNGDFADAPEAPAVAKVSYNGSHTIDTEYGVEDITVANGTWSFDGWYLDGALYEVASIENIKSNIELVGEWKFTANPPVYSGGDDDSSGGGSGGGGGRVVWTNGDYTEDVVTINDEEVPLAAAPMMMTIIDEEVPLGFLPQTGGSAQFLPATCAVEADLRVREEEEE